MPIQIQLQGSIIDHIEMQVPLDDGSTGVRHMMGLTDPISGLRVAIVFGPDELEPQENGDLLIKAQQKPSDLLVASPGDMPPEPGEPGPAQRPPMAGRGRPSR